MKKLTVTFILAFLLSSGTVFAENEKYGGRTANGIQLVFEGLADTIFARFKKELELFPNLNNKVTFKIQILESGNVSVCHWESNEDKVDAMASDICKIIRGANFGRGREFELLYPINFYPEKP